MSLPDELGPDPWAQLRRFTPARVALGRAGAGMPTGAHLSFQFDHARARDAVRQSLDAVALDAALAPLGGRTVAVRSAAPDRETYLRRPDLGRRLDDASRDGLAAQSRGFDTLFVIADGLCARAVESYAAPLLAATLPTLAARGLSVGPFVIARQARVALGDEIGAALGARLVIVLIGERPGLSSPDSLGAYLTFAPRVGRTDAERNCISNIRAAGLTSERAARKLLYLIGEAMRLRLSGVALKDESSAASGLIEAP